MFKRAKVVMLSTNEKATLIGKYEDCNKLIFNNPNHNDIPRGNPQHLYITSDDVIKEGDWCYHLDAKELIQFNSNNGDLKYLCKKVIATTDILPDYKAGIEVGLFLPQPSKAFIEKYVEEYNKGNQITDVLVEYETKQHFEAVKSKRKDPLNGIWYENKPKVNPKDNTSTIKY